jgi:molybdopterin converting factor subunit 1
MIVRVKLFAAARELAGTGEVPVEVADGAAIADVESALRTRCPELGSILKHARWAVDAAFVSPTSSVSKNSEVALIPPVSGG